MAVPAGGEIAIYDAAVETQSRLAVGVERPMWTAEVSDTFGSGSEPDLTKWAFQQLGSGISVTGGDALIRHKGGPLYDWMITRPGWFPEDPAIPFELEIIMTFPQTDPIYSPIVIAGSIDADLSNLDEPAVIWQQGSATGASTFLGATDDGNEKIYSFGSTAANNAGDQASHTYSIQWDPALAVNANKLTVKRDAVTVRTADSTVTRPAYLAFGWVWTRLKNRQTGVSIDDLGTTVSNVIQIHSVKTTQLGAQGYETQSWPGWTSANAGGTTIEDSAERERFTEDNVEQALIPEQQFRRATVNHFKDTESDTVSFELAVTDADDETIENMFQGDRWNGRILLFDNRVKNDAGTATAWKRQIAARITDHEFTYNADGATLVLNARCIPSDKLDVYLTRNFRGEANTVDAMDVNKNLDEIVEILIEIGDKVAGGLLGATDKDVTMATIVPQDIGSGGGTVLSALANIVDRTAHEWWRSYTISSTGRYGEIHVHGPTFGTGSGGYTFHGVGSASAGNFARINTREDRRAGPGMVNYRQNNPMMPAANMTNSVGLPTVNRWPAWPYPPNERILNDSIGVARDASATAVVVYTDKDANTTNGGTAKVRYMKESMRHRAVIIEAMFHDWVEPGDEIDVDDPDFTGLTTGDSWVVDGSTKTWDFAEGTMLATIEAYNSDWTTSVERGLFL